VAPGKTPIDVARSIEALKGMGAELKAIYLTMGAYDRVAVVEDPT